MFLEQNLLQSCDVNIFITNRVWYTYQPLHMDQYKLLGPRQLITRMKPYTAYSYVVGLTVGKNLKGNEIKV